MCSSIARIFYVPSTHGSFCIHPDSSSTDFTFRVSYTVNTPSTYQKLAQFPVLLQDINPNSDVVGTTGEDFNVPPVIVSAALQACRSCRNLAARLVEKIFSAQEISGTIAKRGGC